MDNYGPGGEEHKKSRGQVLLLFCASVSPSVS